MVASPSLQIHLLGDFHLDFDGQLVTTIVQSRLQALLGYLLLHRCTPQSRQKIAFLFWPDSSETQALTNLRQLFHFLRRSLPAAEKYLWIGTRTIQWRCDAPFTLDVANFEDFITQATSAAQEGSSFKERTALESAVRHYGGDLLQGCYDEWILEERERLRQTYLGALERLILLAEEHQDYYAAIRIAERLLWHDPLNEPTYRELMHLHALNGNRASALRVYRACVAILECELGVEPSSSTQETYRSLLSK